MLERNRRLHRRRSSQPGTEWYSGEASISVNALRKFICRPGVSILDGADHFDISDAAAASLLFKKKPTDADITKALSLYEDGQPLKNVCVMSGVSEKHFAAALSRNKARKKAFRALGIQ